MVIVINCPPKLLSLYTFISASLSAFIKVSSFYSRWPLAQRHRIGHMLGIRNCGVLISNGNIYITSLFPSCWGPSVKVLELTDLQRNKDAKHTGLSFQQERWKLCFSTQKSGNGKWLIAWWSVLFVGPGLIKPSQPRLEVASNLNVPYSKGFPKVPQAGLGMANMPKWPLYSL